jgi:imidazole glycerol-phosphate synthase subunit HisF
MSLRIIPRLDIKGPNLVKGVHLEGLRILGKPEDYARYYYESGADELLYMDVVASLYERNSLLDFVTKTSKEIFIPLTVGGGLRTVDDIKHVLRAGADKVSLNTAVIRNPDLIREASRRFGSSTIVVSIEAKKIGEGRYEAYVDNGREKTGVDALEWALRAEELGAGEIMVTSIDQEGTGRGYNIDITSKISKLVSIPVIACGGAGTLEHIHDVVAEGEVDAVCVASVLHYNYLKEINGRESVDQKEVNHLNMQRAHSKIKEASLFEVKTSLLEKGIHCRPL